MENSGFPGRQLQGLNRETSTYVTWPLEPLIQRSSRIRRADEDVKTGEASLALARRRVVADAVRAFFRVALAQEVAEEAEHERGMLEQLATYNHARVDEGVTAEVELLRIQVELDRAATDVVFAEADLTRNVAELLPYLGGGRAGVVGPRMIRVAVPSANVPAQSALPPLDVVLTRAHDRRPEILASRARVAAFGAAEEYERTLAIRQLGATIGNKRVEGQNSMVLGVSLAVPLFNRNRGGVDRARSERSVAEQELAWTDWTIAADLQGIYGAATRLSRQLGDLQTSFLARAEDVQRLTLGAYQEGGATLLQVLDATRTLADAHLTYARLLFAQRQSLFDLALATGARPDEAVDLLRTWSSSSPVPRQTGGAP
jgi:cobalt-zinc-cadmium efflux system outer membrane protein